ncbi:WW domain-containing protein [Cephalotus follicularis]|uniref:WW domain-containing protein n=1 Tax=Cephalotus follicularis TaxID=3775 RepID=A0A1Q3AV91_CEPFO|nr:WW domain-containing protein [Cephalotus follicularis]
MGKRKERRLAALSNAGRRVKLDLFAEPSGDLGGSHGDNEVGGDIDPTQRAWLPNSPSSSGQQQQNPLLLLGQYSDDEVDEESNKQASHAIEDNAPDDHNNQVKGPDGEGVGDLDDNTDEDGSAVKDPEVNADEDVAAQKVDQQDIEKTFAPLDSVQKLESNDTRESHATATGVLFEEMDFAEQIPVPETSDVQIIGDVSLGWRIVMHAESNQYYYWKTLTGETSWEVPDVLTQSTEFSSDEGIPVASNTETAPSGSTLAVEFDNCSAAPSVIGSISTNLVPQSKGMCDNGAQMDEWVQGYKSEELKDDPNQNELHSNSDAVGALLGDVSLAGSKKYVHDTPAHEEHQKAIDLSTHLVKQCEFLLERLKSLKGSKGHLQGDDWVLKYIFEVEIRLSDVKSLLSYGSSLLPFWVHSEMRLKQLEGVIKNEIYQLAVSAQMDDVETTYVSSFREKDNVQEGIGHESRPDRDEHVVISASPEFSNVSTSVDKLKVSHDEEPCREVYGEHVLSPSRDVGSDAAVSEQVSPSRHVGSDAAVSEQVDQTDLSDGMNLKSGINAGEDVDMDVDMEVEDAVPADCIAVGVVTNTKDFAPSEVQSQPAQYPSLISENALRVPPPPDEEWIPPPPPDIEVPPPPPDNEQFPPPPPDEPTESLYPPHSSYAETGQHLMYTGQYNLTYPDSNFQYYGPTVTEVNGSDFYGHGGGQVVLPHTSLYFEAVPGTYTETAPVMVNLVEAVSYYDTQDGTIPPVPGSSSAESSQFHSESVPVSYNTLASGCSESVDALTVARPDLKVDVSAVEDTEIFSVGAPSTSATIQAPATVSENEIVSALSTNVVAGAAVADPSANAKVQSKVLRSKKRTVAVAPSLRSNKKVSSLVDKWKAAKEELNEVEKEEPKTALEILEKKRQREIEEWKARQISSGEAKDNANFQPLGGDWRERVKRRRAQASSKAAEAPAEATTNGRQPDLAEFSRDLPFGWQVYWDDTSKQVYYGNTITSETTWSRPKK